MSHPYFMSFCDRLGAEADTTRRALDAGKISRRDAFAFTRFVRAEMRAFRANVAIARARQLSRLNR